MTFILRWPVVLVLLALVLVSLVAAAAATVVIAQLPIDLSALPAQVAPSADTLQQLGSFNWLQTGLLYGAGIFFLISAIRLMRRTQGFWTWLLGFACFGGRWAVAQQQSGGLANTVQHINPNAFLQPRQLLGSADAPETQVGLLGIIVIVGLIILIVDAADRAHWDRQGA